MNIQEFKMPTYVSLLLKKDETILLIRRAQTGHADGFYACAGGKIDGGESIIKAVCREAAEEIGITLREESLKLIHVVHAKQTADYRETLGFFIEADAWDGEPKNLEPHKHDDIQWFHLDNLPSNTMPTLLHVLKMRKQNLFFSELGWN